LLLNFELKAPVAHESRGTDDEEHIAMNWMKFTRLGGRRVEVFISQ